MKVDKILIPNKPHFDPIAAIYLLWKYGKEKFPGIDKSGIIFWDKSQDPSEVEVDEMQRNNILMIDVGGGIFDHHNNEKENETSTSLVAYYLGIDSRPELATLLNYVREDDLEGIHNNFGELPQVIKCMNKQGLKSEDVVEYALQTLNHLQNSQMEWHYEVKKEFEEKGKIMKVKRHKRNLKVLIIESDNIQVANYALVVGKVSVVVQRRTSGHVMILTNKHHRIDLREIVAAIRMKELEIRGFKKELDPNRLKFEGKNQLLPFWFYHRSLNSFLNGSNALNQTEPTKVPFNDIVKFVLYGLTTQESELCDCSQGGQNCPYKRYGFSKCLENSK